MENLKDPFRLTCLKPEIRGKKKVKFDFGNFTHPLYGCSDKLKGEYRLFHSDGSYRISNYFELTCPEQDELLNVTKARLGYLYEHLDEPDVVHIVLQGIWAAAICFPSLDVHSSTFELALDGLGIICHADDLYEDHTITLEPGYAYRTIFNETTKLQWAATGGNLYDNEILEDKFLKLSPNQEVARRALNAMKDKLQTEFPDGSYKQFLHFILSSGNGAEGSIFNFTEENQVALSEQMLSVLRGYDSGMETFLEGSCVLQRIKVPKVIRMTLLFKMLLTCVRNFGGLSNDVLGLLKDVKGKDTNRNVILRKIVRENISIEDGFEQTLKSLRDTIADMEVVMAQLKEAFPADDGLHRFIEAAKDICDGQTIGYVLFALYKGRYGKMDIEILPVEDVAC